MSECAGKLARAREGAVNGGAVVAKGVSALDYWCDHCDEMAFALVQAIGQPMRRLAGWAQRPPWISAMTWDCEPAGGVLGRASGCGRAQKA